MRGNNRGSKGRILTTSLLVMLLVSVFSSGFSVSYAQQELTAQEKTLAFLSDVAMIDLSKYNVTLRKYEVSYPEEWGGLPEEEVRYILEANDSYLDATCSFLNGVCRHCLLSWRQGSPVYVQPQPSDVVDMAKATLERYRVYTGSSRYDPLLPMLDLINETEITYIPVQDRQVPAWIVTSGSYRLQVTETTHQTQFIWFYTIHGVETMVLKIRLEDGALYSIGGALNLFAFSDAEVAVAQEVAVAIAIEEALSCSWKVPVDGVTQEVMAEGIASVAPTAELGLTPHPSRDPFVYYPFWRVDVWLDRVYPGGIYFVSVAIWADTGEVLYVNPSGSGGGAPPPGDLGGSGTSSPPSSSSGTPSSSSEDSALQDPPATPDSEVPSSSDASSESTQESERAVTPFSATLLIAVAVASAVLICAGLLLYFIKFKKRGEV